MRSLYEWKEWQDSWDKNLAMPDITAVPMLFTLSSQRLRRIIAETSIDILAQLRVYMIA